MPSSTDPNISVHSIVLTSCSCLTLHSCVFHSCTHCLAVFLLTVLISPTNVLSSDSIYNTPTTYVIWYVWISTLIIVFIVYSTSGHSWHHFELPNSNFWTAGNTLALLQTLCSPLLRLCWACWIKNEWVVNELCMQLPIHITPCFKRGWELLALQHFQVVFVLPPLAMRLWRIFMTPIVYIEYT